MRENDIKAILRPSSHYFMKLKKNLISDLMNIKECVINSSIHGNSEGWATR